MNTQGLHHIVYRWNKSVRLSNIRDIKWMHKLIGIPLRSFGLFCILKYFPKKSMELCWSEPVWKTGLFWERILPLNWRHKMYHRQKTISKRSNKQMNGRWVCSFSLLFAKHFPQEAVARGKKNDGSESWRYLSAADDTAPFPRSPLSISLGWWSWPGVIIVDHYWRWSDFAGDTLCQQVSPFKWHIKNICSVVIGWDAQSVSRAINTLTHTHTHTHTPTPTSKHFSLKQQ